MVGRAFLEQKLPQRENGHDQHFLVAAFTPFGPMEMFWRDLTRQSMVSGKWEHSHNHTQQGKEDEMFINGLCTIKGYFWCVGITIERRYKIKKQYEKLKRGAEISKVRLGEFFNEPKLPQREKEI